MDDEQQLLNQAMNMHPGAPSSSGQPAPGVTSDCDYVLIPQDHQQQQPQQSKQQSENTKKQIEPNLESLRISVREIDTVIKHYRNSQEDFVLQYQGVQKIDSDIQAAQAGPKTPQQGEESLERISGETRCSLILWLGLFFSLFLIFDDFDLATNAFFDILKVF